jgi:sulfite reductase (NADPH) flavoprotein alpha-component
MTRRVQPIQCIGCPTGCGGEVIIEDGMVIETRGFTCDTGRAYAAEEVVAPKRMVTTTVRVEGGALPLLPVVSDRPILKGSIFDCLRLVRNVVVAAPVAADTVILADVLGLGVNFLASRDCASFDSPQWGETSPTGAAINPAGGAPLPLPSETDDAGVAADAELADTDDAPWHNPSLPLDERMAMADGKPLALRLMAAMAQEDCGTCGYDCAGYANALFLQDEERLTLCTSGGKDTARVLRQLAAEIGVSGPLPTIVNGEARARATVKESATARDNPREAKFLSRRRLNGDRSLKSTWHLEFDLSVGGLDYAVGDSIGIFPKNPPKLVDQVIAALGADPRRDVGGKSLREALLVDVSLGAAPDELFRLISYVVGGERRAKARALANGEDPDGDATTLDVLAALHKFEDARPDAEAFLEALEALSPRLYSIASSPKTNPGHVDLTVEAVRYRIGARERFGVASTFLCERLAPGEIVKAYVQKAHGFRLPDDPRTPIMMVGPGTGVAPFRAFLKERQAIGAHGPNWLFFGHQHRRTDFFYEDEFEAMRKSGHLTRLSLAWSRDGERKFYVQDSMRESGPELWRWLAEGAHIYVCGDAKRMAKDVERALIDIIAEHGGRSAEEAANFLVGLKKAGRYQTDVY